MPRRELAAGAVLAATLVLTGCSGSSEVLGEASDEAAQVVTVEGSEVSRITLTQEASDRLAVHTEPVRDGVGRGNAAPAALRQVPASAVLYDAQGRTWTYVRLEALTFERVPVTVERFQGDVAYLSAGPEVGTPVVTVAAPELLGVEQGVEGE